MDVHEVLTFDGSTNNKINSTLKIILKQSLLIGLFKSGFGSEFSFLLVQIAIFNDKIPLH